MPHLAFVSVLLALGQRGIVGAIVLVIMLITAAALFGTRARTLTGLVRLGQPVERFDDVPKRVELEATVVLGQRKLFQRFLPGPDARVHLLGLPRPADDDRRGAWARW